uniref:Uncharacterized protein n=1 Tax=Rhizophora mucronata TaxID=61149 RepID=A0A2P2QA49_RHIMU
MGKGKASLYSFIAQQFQRINEHSTTDCDKKYHGKWLICIPTGKGSWLI